MSTLRQQLPNLLIGGMLLLAARESSALSLNFEEIKLLSAPPGPSVTGDFDGDGRLDLAVAQPSPGNVAVLYGDGAGDFPTSATFSAGGSAFDSMVAGDYDGDGRTDLAISYGGEQNIIAILIGLLLPAVGEQPVLNTYPGGGGLLVQGDFDGDGRTDLTVMGDGSVRFLRGSGDGSFAEPLFSQFSFGALSGVAAGDYDGDGREDLFLAEPGANRVHVLSGNGQGMFGMPQTLTVGSAPESLTLADLNLDGKADLLSANFGASGKRNDPGSISVSRNLGDGTFAPAVHYLPGEGWTEAVVGDFDGDGWPDVAALNSTSASLALLRNNNEGRLMPTETHSTGGNPLGLLLLDYNRDNLPDLASPAMADGSVRFFTNVMAPRASAVALQQKLHIVSPQMWHQGLLFNFSTRELNLSGPQYGSGHLTFDQPFGQWTGGFLYSYAAASFVGSRYGTTQLLLPAVQ